jgi:hypothetical protein
VANKLAQAWAIARGLPEALDAMAAGELDHPRLLALFDVTRNLADGHRSTVAGAMLGGSRLRSPAQWRRKARRLATRIDPDGATRRHRQARALRDVSVQPMEDGMATLSAVLPAQDALAIRERLDLIARSDARAEGERRSIGARRADVLSALLLGNRRELVKVEVQVIAPVGTLAGLDDHPMELVGYGPISAEVGRALAADARWRRVLTDAEIGAVLDLGRRRIPTPALARLIRHRDVRCTFPGCGVPAERCDVDHTVAYAQGGRTAFDNLGTACRHHHKAKHEGRWSLDQPEPGVFVWTSPEGRSYRTTGNDNEEEAAL